MRLLRGAVVLSFVVAMAQGCKPGEGEIDAGHSDVCTANQHVSGHACVPCAPGATRAAGDDASGADTACAAKTCAVDTHVVAHACVPCAAGRTRVAGDDAAGADTTCDVILCAADQHVVGHACTACAAGSTNAAGDDASGADTGCDATLCAGDQHVQNHACVSCVAGTTNLAGDDASAVDTSCDGIACASNQHVVSHACVACVAGSTRVAGDDASGSDTSCDATLCGLDQHVVSHACVSCAPGTANAAGNDATGADTACTAVTCAVNERVLGHACVACPPGSTNVAGNDASGADTSCTGVLCALDQHVEAHACVACAAGTANAAGDDASGADTSCPACVTGCAVCSGTSDTCSQCAPGYSGSPCQSEQCATNFHVVNHACVACTGDLVRDAGDDTGGDDTLCLDVIPPTATVTPARINGLLLVDDTVRFAISEPIAGAPSVTPVLSGTLAGSAVAHWDGNTLVVEPLTTWPLGAASLSITVQDLGGNSVTFTLSGTVTDAIYVDTHDGIATASGGFGAPVKAVATGIALASAIAPEFPVRVTTYPVPNGQPKVNERILTTTPIVDLNLTCLNTYTGDSGLYVWEYSFTLASTPGHKTSITNCNIVSTAHGDGVYVDAQISGSAVFTDSLIGTVSAQPGTALTLRSTDPSLVNGVRANPASFLNLWARFNGVIAITQGTLTLENAIATRIDATDTQITINNGGATSRSSITRGSLDYNGGVWVAGLMLTDVALAPAGIRDVTFVGGQGALECGLQLLETGGAPQLLYPIRNNRFIGECAFVSSVSHVVFENNDVAQSLFYSLYCTTSGLCVPATPVDIEGVDEAQVVGNRISGLADSDAALLFSANQGATARVLDNVVLGSQNAAYAWASGPADVLLAGNMFSGVTRGLKNVSYINLEHNLIDAPAGISGIPRSSRWNVFSGAEYDDGPANYGACYFAPGDSCPTDCPDYLCYSEQDNSVGINLLLDESRHPTAKTPCVAMRTSALASQAPALATYNTDRDGAPRTLPYSAGAYESDGACGCLANEYVSGHTCVACQASSNTAGDDITGADTTCDGTLCGVNQRVAAHVCSDCAPGSARDAGDDTTGPDTQCTGVVCGVYEHVSNHTCVACPPGYFVGGQATGADTTCMELPCDVSEHVVNHACVACPSGMEAGGFPSGPDTSCFVEVPAAPVVSFSLDDTSAPAVDSVSGLTATAFGSPTWLSGPVTTHGSSVAFSGSYLEVAAGPTQNPSHDYSVEFWMKPAAFVSGGTFQSPVSSRNYDANICKGYNFYIEPDQRLSFFVGSGGSTWNVIYGPVINANTIYHVVGTYSETTQTMMLYVNGSFAGAQSGVSAVPNLTWPTRIGGAGVPNALTFPFNGSVDNVAIYPSPMSGATALARYSAGMTP